MSAKRILALLLALVLTLGLAACGGTTTTNPPEVLGDTTPEAPETPDVSTDPETPEEPEVLEPWDGNYEEATFADVRKYGIGSTKWDGSLPLTTTGEKVELGLPTTSKVTDWDDNPLTKWLEEQTGIDLQFRTFAGSNADITTQLMLMFTGGEDMPDIITTHSMASDQRSDLVNEGYLANLAGYFMTHSYYMSQAIEKACKDDPVKKLIMMDNMQQYTACMQTLKVYGTPTFVDTATDLINTECVINKDWLDKLGLQAPTTVDELYDVLVAFRDKDPNGNGKKDEVPMMGVHDGMGRGIENFLITPFIQYAYNVKVMIEDGKAYCPYSQDEYREALIFINKLVKEGLLHELTFTSGGSELIRMLNPTENEPQIVGMATLWITNDFKEYSTAIDSYIPVAALKDATGRGGYSFTDPTQVRSRYSIHAEADNVLLAFQLMDFMYSPEAYMRLRYGEEGVDWDWIENTKFKDKAKGNGVLGGDASYVLYTDSQRVNSRWFVSNNTFQDEFNYQAYVDPDDATFAAKRYRLSAENVRLQQAVGDPPEEMHVMQRTPEEDELFWETNTDLTAYYKKAKNEFCIGRRDPNSDADWQEYLDDINKLKIEEYWTQIGAAVYARWLDRLEEAGLK